MNNLTESFPVPLLGVHHSGVQVCTLYNERYEYEKGHPIEMIGVSPRVRTHVSCGGRLLKTNCWDVMTCEGCGETVNRYHHAAKTYAHRALSAYQGSLQTVL